MEWHLNHSLFFAGEAYYDDMGYVHAAYLNGIENANKILACMGYDEDATNGEKCPDEYVPISDNVECQGVNDSVDGLIWLWISITFICGMIVGAFVCKQYLDCREKYAFDEDGYDAEVGVPFNYGSVDDLKQHLEDDQTASEVVMMTHTDQ